MNRYLSVLVLLALTVGACEGKKTNMTLCRDVYTLWCERAYECGTLDAINACLVYYSEDCRQRRMNVGVPDPTESQVDACLTAIPELGCTALDPLALDECSFLLPLPEDGGVDGGEDGGDDSGADEAGLDSDVAEGDVARD